MVGYFNEILGTPSQVNPSTTSCFLIALVLPIKSTLKLNVLVCLTTVKCDHGLQALNKTFNFLMWIDR